MLERMWRNRSTHTLLVKLQIDTTTMENSMEVPQKTKNDLLYDPAIPLLGIYLKDFKTHIQKDICTPAGASRAESNSPEWGSEG